MSRASRALARSAVLAAAAAILLASPGEARANGRFPAANQLVFAPNDPDLVLLRVTFGLLVSHDRGKTFEWVCEQSIGYSGVEDPMYAVTPSGTIVGTTFQGLTLSKDDGCGWSFGEGELGTRVFVDLSQSPTDRERIVVFSTEYEKQDDAGNLSFRSTLWETKDGAETFTKLGSDLDPTLLGSTIDVTATDPDRLYATAVRTPSLPKAVLLVSKDHGASWQEEPVELVENERAVYIAGVDPTNADRVYLRTSGGTDKPTRLILREGGEAGPATQRVLYTGKGPLLGFALSPDGSKVYVGGPRDGLLVASTTDHAFAQRIPLDQGGAPSIEIECLAMNGSELWACSNERSGFIAGVSKDDGVTFEPRLRFCQIGGPVASCGPGTPTNDRCAPNWPAQKALLGCAPMDQDGGTSPEGGAGPGGPGAPPGGGTTPKGGCDCHASPAAGPWGALAAVAGAALAFARRARRRRS